MRGELEATDVSEVAEVSEAAEISEASLSSRGSVREEQLDAAEVSLKEAKLEAIELGEWFLSHRNFSGLFAGNTPAGDVHGLAANPGRMNWMQEISHAISATHFGANAVM